MASPTIQFKRGAFVNLPDLVAGEPGFTTDFYDFYVGTSGVGTVTNQFFGSSRYWEREAAGTAAKLKLFESTGSGTNSLTFQSPNTLSGVGTFIFPDTTDGQAGDALIITGVTNGVYTLEWSSATAGAVSGITLRTEGAAAPPEGASGIGSVTTVDVVGTGVTAEFDNTTVTGVGTIRVYTATATQEGTARFSSSDFTVTSGLVELASDIIFTDATFTNINVTGVSTFTDVNTTNINVTGVGTVASLDTTDVTVGGALTVTGATDLNGGLDVLGFTDLDDVNVSSALTSVIVNVSGALDVTGNTTLGDDASDTLIVNATASFDNVTVGGALTVTGATDLNGGLDVSGGETILSSATISDLTQDSIVYVGASGSLIDSTNLTFNGTTFTVGSGVGITQFSDDTTLADSSSTTIPTENAVKSYVDTLVGAQDLDFAGDSGTGAVDLDTQSLTISGTTNEIETSAAGQTLTVGLPNVVVVGTSLSAPTLLTTTIQQSNGTTALTIDASGNVTAAQNVTISGDLFVNGTTTQINTATLTVEDSLIGLAVTSGGPPSVDLNIDVGILMHWYDTQQRTAAVFWDDSVSRVAIAQSVTETASVLAVGDWAAVEMGEVWLNDTAGQNAVMSYLAADTLYTGQTAGRYLQSITVDGGEF